MKIDLNERLEKIEIIAIKKALRIAKGNKTVAAGLLCLKRTTLVEKIKRLEIETPQLSS